MIAVTWLEGTSIETSRTACVSPNQALSETVRIAHTAPSEAPTISPPSRSVTRSVMPAAVPCARDHAGDEADHQHQRDEHQCAGPRLGVPVVVGADRVGEDLQRERGDRL